MKKTELSISFTRSDSSKLSSDFETASSSFSADSPVVIKKLNTETIAGYTTLNDIYGNPGLFLRVEMPRDILKHGRYSTHSFIWVLLSVGVIVLIVLLFTLQTTVLGPLRKLKNHILSIGESGDLSVRLSLKRKDEIGILAGEFDKMLIKMEKRSSDLEELNKKMQGDIQKRRRAEKALRESEERYRAVVKQASDGIYLIDPDTKTILETNRSFQNMIGYKPDEILRLNIYDVVAHDRTEIDANIKKIISKKYYFVGERKYRHKDGTILDFEASSNLISFGGKDVLCVVVRDITEFKKIEEDKAKLEVQLQRAQKMEAIGTLAGGVAHDLNNIFSGLVSYPELLLMDLPQDSPLKKPLLTIKKSGEKAATIVQDLLTLARRGIAVTEVVSLNQVISEFIKSPESEKLQTFHPEVKIETSLDAKLLNVFGSPVHLTKTVMNLVSNAAESMINGGKVIITTKNQYIDHPIKGYDEVEEGDYVVLRVIDNGIGISAKDMERIFEPFYSKKVMGRSGTGLGMAVVWGTVKDHKGYIDVQSTDGKGTTFTLYFPITRMEISKDESSLSIEDYMGSGELILVVDDVEEQREIASEMLRKLGYSVESAASGEEAVEYMENNTTDLIILDMIMEPGINGRETYENILKYHPNQKAIIASGFSETDDVKKAQELGAGKYIKKPYILEKIGLAVRDELARNRHLQT
jgi:PAS domain S-box-containing protein